MTARFVFGRLGMLTSQAMAPDHGDTRAARLQKALDEMSPDERAEKVSAALVRKAFLDALPNVRNTLIDFVALEQRVRALRNEYASARPFPHVVIDDFLPGSSFERVLAAMPGQGPAEPRWNDLNSAMADGRPAQTEKLHLDNALLMRPILRELMGELNCAAFLTLLGQLTGIHGLLSDPYLTGAGVHVVRPGGMLRVHTDFREHPTLNLDRRLNLLLYMNPDWKEAYGGHLELWNEDSTRVVRRILPIANRCVIFGTTDRSFHGHPRPLTCPDDRHRQSIALYYFTTKPRDAGSKPSYTTNWQVLPDEGER